MNFKEYGLYYFFLKYVLFQQIVKFLPSLFDLVKSCILVSKKGVLSILPLFLACGSSSYGVVFGFSTEDRTSPLCYSYLPASLQSFMASEIASQFPRVPPCTRTTQEIATHIKACFSSVRCPLLTHKNQSCLYSPKL